MLRTPLESVLVLVFVLVMLVSVARSLVPEILEDRQYWMSVGKKELKESLGITRNLGRAENVILFVGDGMGPNTVTASRIYKGGESSKLSFEQFPHMGLLKTYSVDKQVPDSASTATALFSGVKVNSKTAGLDARVQLNDCAGSLNEDARIPSIIDWAQAAGKDTGFVTTTRVTHATPSALYAHVANRRWECESAMPKNVTSCKDIARQMIEEEPGRNIKVIFGGGRQCLVTNSSSFSSDPIDSWACSRQDGLDLIEEWKNDKRWRKLSHSYLNKSADLDSLDVENTNFVLGIFANGHLKMENERDKSKNGMPSLSKMTETALRVLSKNDRGFLLVVEGGMIDFAHHRGHARLALEETLAFNQAIEKTLTVLHEMELIDSTLIIVTSDHTHSLTINGYPNRGSNILGVAQTSKEDKLPYTTLMYATGGRNNFQYRRYGSSVGRDDPTTVDTTSWDYSHIAAVMDDEAHHGGGDVAVYATGPMAHLFHSVHEQNYVAHVISYAAQIGPYKESSGVGKISGNLICKIAAFIFVLVIL